MNSYFGSFLKVYIILPVDCILSIVYQKIIQYNQEKKDIDNGEKEIEVPAAPAISEISEFSTRPAVVYQLAFSEKNTDIGNKIRIP